MSQRAPELVILSGGSEVAALAVAAAAAKANIPYAVFSLVSKSVLQGAPGCVGWEDLSQHLGQWPQLRDAFLTALARANRHGVASLALLPTEDGGLRLLNECRNDVLAYGEFPRARALRMGGVDKAEVVELAEHLGVTQGMARSIVLNEPTQAGTAMDALGADVVFKPALKPISMDLSSMGGQGAKVVTRRPTESTPQLLQRLYAAWPLSQRWIAQPRLRTGAGLERSVCAVRGAGVRACQVVERGKYPHMGGTAYWVSTEQRRDLIPSAQALLEALDIVGICELSYLPDVAGMSLMIEFNPRPWLQVGLVERAGLPIISETMTALRGGTIGAGGEIIDSDWLQLERMGLALLAGQATWRAWQQVFKPATTIAGWDGVWPSARRQLLRRMLGRLLGRQG